MKEELQRIAEAENQAGDIVAGGRREADRILKEEEEERSKRQREGIEQAQKEAETLLKVRLREARQQRMEELETLRRRLQTQPLASGERIREAIDLVKKRLLPAQGKGPTGKL